MMAHQTLLLAALALLNVAGVLGQAAGTTSNPLNSFIGGVQQGAGAINSAVSAQTSSSSSSSSTSSPTSSSTTPTASPAKSSAAAPPPQQGLSNGAKIGIIVGCVVAAVLLIGLLAGICCCLMLRRRRRRRAVTPVADEEVKSWKSKPTNPGRNYSPVAAHGRSPSMEQHPTMPLMAAGAIPHGSHSQAPSLSQHPAMRNENENPFADNVAGTHNNSHHGLEAAAVGATAAGAAGYGMHRHHQAGTHPTALNTHPTTHSSHHGLESGVAGAAAAGVVGHGLHGHHEAGGHQLNSHAHPIAQQQHHGLPPALAAATVGPTMGHGMQHRDAANSLPAATANLTPNNHNGLASHPRTAFNNGHDSVPSANYSPSHPGVVSNTGHDALPSASHPSSSAHNGLKGAAAGAAVAGAAGYGAHRHHENKQLRNETRARSRSNSRPRSGLPTHNDADRPPTPFGLSGIGQPYEDMHVHVLQGEAPSHELRHSLHKHERAPLAAGVYDDSDHEKFRNSRGYATPPQVPSRSPHRENRASTFAESSYESSLNHEASTSSNSGGEQYQQARDPYQPARPNHVVAPWEQHQTRYSSTPPTSATMTPPPVPWEDTTYAKPRQQNHSPRQSVDASGRRSSRSPGAISINGQPRRLRFEDLQAGSGGRNSGYGGVNQHDSYDGHDQARWSQGVGEAL